MPPRSPLSLPLLLALALPLPFARASDKPRTPPPPRPAPSYPLHDTHPLEHVTVAVEPANTPPTRPDTRLDYARHGFLVLRIVVTNNGPVPLSLDDARILFHAADHSSSNAATEEDLQRRLFTLKSTRDSHIPVGPISIPIHHKSVDSKILADLDDFGFKTTTVAPGATIAGYLLYDIRDLDEPVLPGATLEVRKLRLAPSNKALDTFEIPLNAPSATPAAPAAP